MATEVEIKFVVEDIKKARAKLKAVSSPLGQKHQIDEYFEHSSMNSAKNKNLKEYLRIRNTENKSQLDYHRCIIKNNEKSHTEEFESEIQKPEEVRQILLGLRFKPKVIVNKKRELFETENFLLYLDEVQGLGCFFEVEAKKISGSIEKTKEDCRKFAEQLGIQIKIAPKGGYPDLLAKKTPKVLIFK